MNVKFGEIVAHNAQQRERDPKRLDETLHALLVRIHSLEDRLENTSLVEHGKSTEWRPSVIKNKRDRLSEIRHGLTELSERMLRPYVVSSELQAVKDVLDTLADTGTCNSVILEGAPGTGKTQWAYAEVGQELREGKDSVLIHIRVKETTTAQDLLYTVDHTRRLNDAQSRAEIPGVIRKEAAEWREKILNGDIDPEEDRDYLKFKAKMKAVEELGETSKDLDYMEYVDLGPLGEAIKQSSEGKTVWLIIDEIEKGREELMTGLLDEIENLIFTIAETGTTIKGDKRKLRIVITTNTEDSDKIPNPFRRRSLYHFMEYPTQRQLAEIVYRNFPSLDDALLKYALNVYFAYHDHPQIEKKPSTPELLAWIQVLSREFDGEIPDNVPHKEILLKYRDDLEVDVALDEIREETLQQQQEERLEQNTLRYLTKAAEGERVFKIDNEAFSDPNAQKELGNIYADLDRLGCHFITPIFEPEKDAHNDETGNTTLKRAFQLLVPGFEDLGNGYCVIPQAIERVLAPLIQTRVVKNTLDDFANVGIQPKDLIFDDVQEKNAHYVHGSLRIGTDSEDAVPHAYRLGTDTYIFEEDYHVEEDW